jgi:hypothetical protein
VLLLRGLLTRRDWLAWRRPGGRKLLLIRRLAGILRLRLSGRLYRWLLRRLARRPRRLCILLCRLRRRLLNGRWLHRRLGILLRRLHRWRRRRLNGRWLDRPALLQRRCLQRLGRRRLLRLSLRRLWRLPALS